MINSVARKLMLSFLSVVLVVVVGLGVMYGSLGEVRDSIHRALTTDMQVVRLVREMHHDTSRMFESAVAYVSTGEEVWKNRYQNWGQSFERRLSTLRQRDYGTLPQEKLEELRERYKLYKSGLDQLIEDFESGRLEDQTERLEETRKIQVTLGQYFQNKLKSTTRTKLDRNQQQILNQLNWLHIVMYGTGLVTVVLALGIGYFISRRFKDQLDRLLGSVRNIQAGNLTDQVEVSGDDELAHLGQAFNQMTDRLRTTTVGRERLRLALETADLGMWEWDPSSGRLEMDQRSRNLLGLDTEATMDELVNNVHDGDREQVQEVLDRVQENGERQTVQFRARDQDGDNRVVDLYVEPVPEEGDERIIGALRDITEEEAVRRELKEQAEFLQRVNDRMPGVVYQFQAHPDGQYTFPYLSDGFEAVTGVPAEVAEESFEQATQYVHPEDREEFFQSVENAIDQEAPWEQEFRYELPDGTVKWVRGSSYPDKRPDGSLVYSGVLIDITDRKALEKEARQQRDLFEEAINSSPNLILIKDWHGVFHLVNDTAVEFFGKPREEIIGRTEDAVLEHDHEVERVYEDDRQVMETGEDLKIPEERFERPDTGEERIMKTRKIPLHTERDKEDRRVLVVANEITEQVQLRDRIQQSLEEKETLLEEIHHRVKNNLQVVMSLLRLQNNEIEDPDARAAFEETVERVRSMALIHEKLYESDDLADVNFHDYVEDLCQQLLRAHQLSGPIPELNLDVEKHLELELEDVVPLGLIINELVVNALEHGFGPEVEAPQLSINLRSTGAGTLRLTVRDNGTGMEDELEESEMGRLGFQLLEALVTEQLHGNYTVTADEGTTVEVEIPLDSS